MSFSRYDQLERKVSFYEDYYTKCLRPSDFKELYDKVINVLSELYADEKMNKTTLMQRVEDLKSKLEAQL